MNDDIETIRRALESNPDNYVFSAADGGDVSVTMSLEADDPEGGYLEAVGSLVLSAEKHTPMDARAIIYNLVLFIEKNRESPSIARSERR